MDKCSKPLVLMILDVLKPHKPNVVEFGELLCGGGVDGISMAVYAVDEKTESIKITLEGKNIDFDKVRSLIEDTGAVVHSIDKVAFGQKIAEK